MATNQNLEFSLVEASIEHLQTALSTGLVTCVELVSKLLHRISTYDCRGVSLNAIPILNHNVFSEAAASDERRANGKVIGPLDGIPYTIKDSYKVIDMTVANGSPAFQDLLSNEDAFVAGQLRKAGAVLIGRTNMPPMAASGMIRGVYGRAESPYNLDYLAAAFASGSSNGSAVSTAASFAAFGLGGETVSSGRSPASNNSLIAYTPTKGGISATGIWPLYPPCDVVITHTRTMDDLFILLDVIAAKDEVTKGDFWRNQPFVEVQDPWVKKPKSLRELSTSASLKGLRIGVPEMYVGGKQPAKGIPVHTSASVLALWHQAKADLERLGASVTLIPSFPIVEEYENPGSTPLGQSSEAPRLPQDWNTTERFALIAHAWETFLMENRDPNITSLSDVRHEDVFPPIDVSDPQMRHFEPTNKVHYDKLAGYAKQNHKGEESIYDVPRLSEALTAMEAMRKTYFEDWMSSNNVDCIVLPANGDVGAADADVNHDTAVHAWKNGVKYSNGNRAFRHVGIPSITVPMGVMEDKGMPVGLTFLGRGGSDIDLLRWGKAYEDGSRRRCAPNLVPALSTDQLSGSSQDSSKKASPPDLIIETCVASTGLVGQDMLMIEVYGEVTAKQTADSDAVLSEPVVEVFIDASQVPGMAISVRPADSKDKKGTSYQFSCKVNVPAPPQRDNRSKVASRRKIARDSTLVVVLARQGLNGRPTGCLKVL